MDREEAIAACVAFVCIAVVLIFGPTRNSKCTCVESKPWRQDYTTTNYPARIETGLPIFPPGPKSAGRIVATNGAPIRQANFIEDLLANSATNYVWKVCFVDDSGRPAFVDQHGFDGKWLSRYRVDYSTNLFRPL